MAGSRKKRALAENEHNNAEQTEIKADFEGRNPEYEDFHGIKQLLKQLFLKSHIDTGKLTELIISQTGLGTVLKQSFDGYEEEDDDNDEDLVDESEVFGISTVINLTAKQDIPVIQELISFLKELATQNLQSNDINKVKNLFSGTTKVGLLLNERFINIPPKISDPLLSSLQTELNKIASKDSSYNFDYFIVICKTYKNEKNGEEFFSNQEEVVFSKESDFSFEFSVSTQADTRIEGKWTEDDVEMTPFRKIVFFKATKLPQIINSVKELVS